MKKLLIAILALATVLMMAGCSNTRQDDEEGSSEPDEQISVSEPSESSSNAPESSTAPEPSTSSESAADNSSEAAADNESAAATQNVPSIDVSVFYVDEPDPVLSIHCGEIGSFGLSSENAKALMTAIDFSNLEPLEQAVEYNSFDPGIEFTATGSNYELLRLNPNSKTAVYESGGTKSFYSMTDEFYESAFQKVSGYLQYAYSGDGAASKERDAEIEIDPDGNWNV